MFVFNIILLLLGIVLLYLGKTYKALIIFIFGMCFDELYSFIYKLRTPHMYYNSNLKNFSLKFFLKGREYIMIIPESDIIVPEKILAISNTSNKTDLILQIQGPCGNFFGNKITPKDLGMKNVKIWINKNRYNFNENNYFNFSPENISFSDYSDSEDI